MSLLKRLLSDKSVQQKYIDAGASFGDAVSYSYAGEVVGFQEMLKNWEAWEEEYARRGFRTISLDAFINFGGYGEPIDHILNKKRDEKEQPILHAKKFKEKTGGKIKPVLDLKKMIADEKPQSGKYTLPSTED